tara:strand:+ start:36 stop:626 length:591 start_codon:yes stop_codon:yes gene_type:complete
MQKKLPKIYYFINEINLSDLSKLSNNINIIYRNYKKNITYNDLKVLKKFNYYAKRKIFVANNIKLAIKYKLSGIYIPSFNQKINYLSSFSIPKNFKIIGSAHNIKEVKIKKQQGCKEIFLSPLFRVKKKKNHLNIYNFNKLTNDKSLKYIALGGINQKNYKKIKLTRSSGLGSISWIKKNGLSKLRPFKFFSILNN